MGSPGSGDVDKRLQNLFGMGFREQREGPEGSVGEEKGYWRLKVAMEFSASHQLRNYCGRCERLHGHNFGVEVEVRGSELKPDTGILVDFKELKAEVAKILDLLDHSHLNELEPFREVNPSSEHLARFIYRELKPRVRAMGVELLAVSVSEKPTSVATYSEGEGR